MKLIVGLGNLGEKYQYTRHNIGFMVVEKLVKELLPVGKSEKAWLNETKLKGLICKVSPDILFLKPQTFMNRSGEAVLKAVNFFKIKPADLWVIHDDIDLPLGKIRIRIGGGSAGHNGVESIITSLNNPEFVRFRLGIGKGKLNLHDNTDYNLHRREIEKYVLSSFRDNEGGEVKKLIKNTVEAVKIALKDGIVKAMNRFN